MKREGERVQSAMNNTREEVRFCPFDPASVFKRASSPRPTLATLHSPFSHPDPHPSQDNNNNMTIATFLSLGLRQTTIEKHHHDDRNRHHTLVRLPSIKQAIKQCTNQLHKQTIKYKTKCILYAYVYIHSVHTHDIPPLSLTCDATAQETESTTPHTLATSLSLENS